MTGYEEAVTDPSYVAQVLCFAYPLIGTYGVDERADRVRARAVRGRGDARRPAGVRRLAARRGVVALAGVDTRTLVRQIRDGGVLRCALGDAPVEELHARALAEPPIDGRPLARHVGPPSRTRSASGPRVVVVDLGSKHSIPRRLAEAGLEALRRPGLVGRRRDPRSESRAPCSSSNGPGDPATFVGAIDAIRGAARPRALCSASASATSSSGSRSATRRSSFRSATAARTTRCATSRPAACSSPSRTTASPSLANGDVSHVSLNDGTCEGLEGDGFASVQFHPEASPGPLDALPFFDRLADACRNATTFARS